MDHIFGALRLPASVIFGCGQRTSLGAIAAPLGRRALICTDARMAKTPEGALLSKDLMDSGIEVRIFGETAANVPVEDAHKCVDRHKGFKPDLIIGLGGGSCMDMAKSVALLLCHGGDLRAYCGENRVPGPVLPVIAIPTTAGTGSEVSPVAVVSDDEQNAKMGIASPYLVPRIALCDPELTLSCPPALTAASGVDALTHAIEAFTAVRRNSGADPAIKSVFVGKNDLSDVFALLAIKNIWSSLKDAYENGNDLAARQRLMFGALAAGCAFGTAGTAGAHAIQLSVGSETQTPHGVGVGLLLPYIMEFNRPTRIEAFAQIARAVDLAGPTDTDDELSKRLIDAVARLLICVGIPRTLKDLGLREDKQNWAAQETIHVTRLVSNNPRLLDLPALRKIIAAAYTGDRASLAC